MSGKKTLPRLSRRQRTALKSLATQGGFDESEIEDALTLYARDLESQGLAKAGARPAQSLLDRIANCPADIWRGELHLS